MNLLTTMQHVDGPYTSPARAVSVRLNDRLTHRCYTPSSFMVHAILGVRPAVRDTRRGTDSQDRMDLIRSLDGRG